jgi:UDP-N-acetylmuramoyl-tripeptide--D-alanyl-D-alanine ligase
MKSLLKHIIVATITWEAKMVLKKYKPKIIAVTGSVGKTSTKDTIFSVISPFVFARKSEKSFNSDIGVPLTVLGCPNGWGNPLLWIKNILEGLVLIVLPNHYPKWLVLEIGADGPGDIKKVTMWVKPDITVATRLSKVPVHVEFFPSPEDVFEEKGYLVRALKLDGTLILNADDEDVLAFRSLVDNKTILYGTGNGSDVLGSNYSIAYEEVDGVKKPVGVKFDVTYKDETREVQMHGALGIQQMYPALAALSVGAALELPFEKMIESLKGHEPSKGRMRILSGAKHSVIIDDTYNSSPVALHEALNTLALIETSGRKVAVLGDMLELGTYSTDEHKKAGMKAGTSANVLYTVGVRSRSIADGALDAHMDEGNIYQYEDSRSAAKDLALMMQEGDTILVKGSQGKRMERIVAEILADKTQAKELLVRQDEEWLGR